MYPYRSLVMILSASSSHSSSAARISCSIWESRSGFSCSCSSTFSSRSKIFTAYQRCCSAGIWCTAASSIWASACSTTPEKVCLGRVLADFAASIAACAASITPSPFSAEISTTLQPSSRESSEKLILSPFLRTTSIILTAITTGMPSSVSWVVKYRFRSRFVPSTMFRTASGRSPIR